MSARFSSLFDNAKKVTLVSLPEEKEEIVEPPPKKVKSFDRTSYSAEEIQVEEEGEDPSLINAQTVFVGNVPSGCTQKVDVLSLPSLLTFLSFQELKKLFTDFGTVQSVRLRNLVSETLVRSFD